MKKHMNHPVQQSKKNFKKTVVDHMVETQELVLSIKKDMNKEIEKRITERLGDYVHRIESALDGTIAIKEMLIEKGVIKRKEYTQRRDEMRKK